MGDQFAGPWRAVLGASSLGSLLRAVHAGKVLGPIPKIPYLVRGRCSATFLATVVSEHVVDSFLDLPSCLD